MIAVPLDVTFGPPPFLLLGRVARWRAGRRVLRLGRIGGVGVSRAGRAPGLTRPAHIVSHSARFVGQSLVQRDITNLNTPAVMSAYYTNFALLMKRLGPGTFDTIKGYGKTAIVNVPGNPINGQSISYEGFGSPTTILPPRIFRIGARFTF